jgi:predicted lysophospholipase L1 biosynthesis ABC-type transport system permease subunit
VWARLANGVTLEQARAEMEAIGAGLEAEYPETNRGWTVNTRPLQEEFVGPQARLVFGLMLAMAIAVLLVGCVNIANLLIARGVARQGEIAIRMAIGASRWRIVRQLLVECAVMAVLGGIASVIGARWVLGVLVGSFPVESPWVASAGLNPRMLGVTAVTALLATVAAGILPAFATRRVSLRSDAHAASRTSIGSARRLTRVLVGAQVALAVMLVMTAGLLSRTVGALQRLDPGFDVSHLLTAGVAPPSERRMRGGPVVRRGARSRIGAARGHRVWSGQPVALRRQPIQSQSRIGHRGPAAWGRRAGLVRGRLHRHARVLRNVETAHPRGSGLRAR